MERNVELLEKTMRHIEDNPDCHDQEQWWCGTTGCFAGWALHFHGMSSSYIESLTWQSCGYIGPITKKAADVLGLDSHEARCLFDADNTRPMLALMVKDLVNGDELRGNMDYLKETR